MLPTAGSFCPSRLGDSEGPASTSFLLVCLASAWILATQSSAIFGRPATRRRPLRAAKANSEIATSRTVRNRAAREEEEGVLVNRQRHTHTPDPAERRRRIAKATRFEPRSTSASIAPPHRAPPPLQAPFPRVHSTSLSPTTPRPRAGIQWTATCRLNALLSLLCDTHSPVLETFPGRHECPIRCCVTREPSATPLAPSPPTAQVPPIPPGRWRAPSHKDVRYQFPRANWQGLDESR